MRRLGLRVRIEQKLLLVSFWFWLKIVHPRDHFNDLSRIQLTPSDVHPLFGIVDDHVAITFVIFLSLARHTEFVHSIHRLEEVGVSCPTAEVVWELP